MRKLIVILFAIGAVLGMSACDNDPVSKSAGNTQAVNGTYKADGFDATIQDNNIEVNIVDGDTSSLYWKGTFPSRDKNVISEADTEALAGSMLGSQDKTKTFTVENGEVSFKITIMGTSKIVHLKKD